MIITKDVFQIIVYADRHQSQLALKLTSGKYGVLVKKVVMMELVQVQKL